MGERKVLVRYIPPDFDPSIIPKFKRDKNRICEVRTMLPFSIRCSTCGEYMGRGKKFNSRKEMCEGDTYMGIRRFRFIIKCSVCSAQISFKTDPKNSDYEMEYGATRNFEVWKDNEAALEEDQRKRQEEEEMDAMKALENRTLDSKNEMDILDALDETLAINRRHQRVDTDAILSKRNDVTSSLTIDDEMMVEAFKAQRKRKQDTEAGGDDGGAENHTNEIQTSINRAESVDLNISEMIAQQLHVEKLGNVENVLSTKIIPKRRKVVQQEATQGIKPVILNETMMPTPSGPSLFAAYGSNSDSD